jgi:hypothetical protein
MEFIVDDEFSLLWKKHCDVVTGVFSDIFIRLEECIKEEVFFNGFDISSNCDCINLDEFKGQFISEFLNINPTINFDFKGYGKQKIALRAKIEFKYEKGHFPLCFDLFEIKEKKFMTKEKAVLRCNSYNYFLQLLGCCNLDIKFEIVDLRLQHIFTSEILDYYLKKSFGEFAYKKSSFNYEFDEWKKYVL